MTRHDTTTDPGDLPRTVIGYTLTAWLASAITVAATLTGPLGTTAIYATLVGLYAGGAIIAYAEYGTVRAIERPHTTEARR